ncbi:MAG: peptidoglycan-binding protein [Acidobacteria bacterium]|nr:peptidoglycan-binding protein [Acidobacteriota bacterium]
MKIGPSFSENIRFVDLARHVSEDGILTMQKILNRLAGANVVPENGQMDPSTRAGLQKFQEENGLPGTGRLDMDTVMALREAIKDEKSAAPGAVDEAVEQLLAPHEMAGRAVEHAVIGLLTRLNIEDILQPPVVMSPSGVEYGYAAVAGDNESIFSAGGVDPGVVLARLTQYDQMEVDTRTDSDRCGATCIIAAAIAKGGGAHGEQGLLDLIDGVKLGVPEYFQDDLDAIREKIANGTATYGDLGEFGEILQRSYGSEEAIDGRWPMPDGQLFYMMTDGNMMPPGRIGIPRNIFTNGQSWPVAFDTDSDGKMDHFVLVGKGQDGRVFVFDPQPTAGQPQIHYEGSTEYQAYIDHMNKTGSGFIPHTEAGADATLNALGL